MLSKKAQLEWWCKRQEGTMATGSFPFLFPRFVIKKRKVSVIVSCLGRALNYGRLVRLDDFKVSR